MRALRSFLSKASCYSPTWHRMIWWTRETFRINHSHWLWCRENIQRKRLTIFNHINWCERKISIACHRYLPCLWKRTAQCKGQQWQWPRQVNRWSLLLQCCWILIIAQYSIIKKHCILIVWWVVPKDLLLFPPDKTLTYKKTWMIHFCLIKVLTQSMAVNSLWQTLTPNNKLSNNSNSNRKVSNSSSLKPTQQPTN